MFLELGDNHLPLWTFVFPEPPQTSMSQMTALAYTNAITLEQKKFFLSIFWQCENPQPIPNIKRFKITYE